MAGIGFELQRLQSRDDLLSPLASIGHAAIVAAGPWLYTVMAILIISEVSTPVLGQETLASFRVLVVYGFSLSLIASGPVIIVATRMLADEIYLRRYSGVRTLFVGALLLTSSATLTVSLLVFVFLLESSLETVAVGVALTQLVGLIWVSLAFCGAVRDYAHVTAAFLTGLAIAVILALVCAAHAKSSLTMIWGFNSGLSIIVAWLTARVLATFPDPSQSPTRAVRSLADRIVRSPALAIGALACGLGVWIDKWVFWGSAYGEVVHGTLLHAPIYDSPMFIASLTIIPSLAFFVTNLETSFFSLYRVYFHSIERHATLTKIHQHAQHLAAQTTKAVVQIMLLQATLSLIVIVLAPGIISATGLQFSQITILRCCAIGALFHLLFLVCSTLLLFFDRSTEYALLQIFFMFLLFVLSYLSTYASPEFFGAGYMLAALAAGLLAHRSVDRTMNRVNYLTFVHGAVKCP